MCNELCNGTPYARCMPASKRRRPRGHIRELPSGSFQVIVYAGTDPLTKKPRYIRETLKTYGAAEVALTRLQGQVDQTRHPKTDITLGQAIGRWLDIAKLEDTTRDRYDDLVRLYITPVLGDLAARKLDAELLESLYARLQRCRDLCSVRRRTGHECRPLSGSTVRKVHYIISAALEQAVRWRHLGVNPAALAIAPAANHTEPDPPSAEEAAQSSAPLGTTPTGARATQHTPSLVAPLLGDRAHRRGRRRAHSRRASRPRQRGRHDAQGVRGMGR